MEQSDCYEEYAQKPLSELVEEHVLMSYYRVIKRAGGLGDLDVREVSDPRELQAEQFAVDTNCYRTRSQTEFALLARLIRTKPEALGLVDRMRAAQALMWIANGEFLPSPGCEGYLGGES